MLDEWEKIKQELSDLGPFDVKQAIERPDFLRQCFSTLLVTTDNAKRRRLENGLKRLASKPEIVFVLSHIILSDTDLNIRLYAASYLANSAPRLVDAVVESETSNNMFEALGNILFMGLSSMEFPLNLRQFLLNGLGVFMAKTFPDIWEDAIERVASQTIAYNPAYVFECLAIFARASKSLTINFNAKQAREAKMWQKFSTVIEPYTINVLSHTTNAEIWESLALMISEWARMRDPLMSVVRPIVSRLIENGCFNPRSLSILISGFNDLEYEMAESRLFLCILLTNHVHTPLLQATGQLVHDSNSGFENNEANSITELIHVLFEFYANIMNHSSRCFLFRAVNDNVEQKEQQKLLIGHMFDFSSQILALCFRRFDISNAIGIFYSTIQQTLIDDFYNIENHLAEIMLAKGQGATSYIFEASTMTEVISFDSNEYEEVEQCRELFLDLFQLVDSLSQKLNSEIFSGNYAELLQKCVSARDLPRMSTILCYLKDLPLSPAYVDVLINFNLNWDSLDFSKLTDEQATDFLANYFGFITTLFENSTYRKQYETLINETVQIAMSFLLNHIKDTNGGPSQHSNTHKNLVHNKENEGFYVSECFKFVKAFTCNTQLDQQFCSDLYCVCIGHYVPSTKRTTVKLLLQCLADCVSADGPNSKSIGQTLFETINERLSNLCSMIVPKHTSKVVKENLKECIEDVATFCMALSKEGIAKFGLEFGSILWELISFLVDNDVEAELIYLLIDPFLTVITPEVYKSFANSVPGFVHKYPELVSPDFEGIFAASTRVPVVKRHSITMSSQEVEAGDQSALELLFVFFRRHTDPFLAYLSKMSSMSSTQNFITASIGIALKSVTRSFADEGIVRGLRVIEVIMEIRNDAVLSCLNGTHVHVVPAVLDLIFSIYFSCAQMSIAKILLFYAHLSPNEFKEQIQIHKVGSMKGAEMLLVDKITRPLILKQIIIWNNEWTKSQPDD
ncbi:hypothetical protein M3Y97_00871800 [Aphelenchoides bicaudatus]|nr:hypothetical protein M3Y97_00871800 [Aphelenchoides bicaudatus]